MSERSPSSQRGRHCTPEQCREDCGNPANGARCQYPKPVSDAMVESVMRDLLTAQLAVVQTLKPAVHDDYMRAMRNHVRIALEKALAL